MADDTRVTLSPQAVTLILSVMRALVIATSVMAWNMFLNVRDMQMKLAAYEKEEAHLPGSMSRRDWEYEKKLLLVDHELFSKEIETLHMQIEELRDR